LEKGIKVGPRGGGTRTLKERLLWGVTTGGERPCTMEGCPGKRIAVRWPDGRLTWPCTKGMNRLENGSYLIG